MPRSPQEETLLTADRVTQAWDAALGGWQDPYRCPPARIRRLAQRMPVTTIRRRCGGLTDATLIELGCGGGALGLACALHGARITLLDNAAAVLESAHRNRQDLETAEGRSLPVQTVQADLFTYQAPQPFDLCISDGLVEHWLTEADRICVLQAHVRLVRAGGLVAVCIPNNVHPWMERWERAGWPWTHPACPLQEAKLSPTQLADEMRQAGLQDVQVEGYLVWDMLGKWPKRRCSRLMVQILKAVMGYDSLFRIPLPVDLRRRWGTWLVGTGLVAA